VYPTDTIVDEDGEQVNSGEGGLTSSLNGLVLSWVTLYRLAGATVGGTVIFPVIRNRIDTNILDIDTGLGYTDMILQPINLGWKRGATDLLAAYSLYLPTGKFEHGGTENTGLGMVGQEVAFGFTRHDTRHQWNGAANLAYEWHTEKKDTDIRVGHIATIEGGVGRTIYKKVNNPVPLMTTFGVAAYAQFKVTGDSGDDIPTALRGFEDRVFAAGPEVKVYVPQARIALALRVLPEFGARMRTEGLTVSFMGIYTLKSLAKP
jgi:hypothetical protein